MVTLSIFQPGMLVDLYNGDKDGDPAGGGVGHSQLGHEVQLAVKLQDYIHVIYSSPSIV